jgi:hypothetical protein
MQIDTQSAENILNRLLQTDDHLLVYHDLQHQGVPVELLIARDGFTADLLFENRYTRSCEFCKSVDSWRVVIKVDHTDQGYHYSGYIEIWYADAGDGFVEYLYELNLTRDRI